MVMVPADTLLTFKQPEVLPGKLAIGNTLGPALFF